MIQRLCWRATGFELCIWFVMPSLRAWIPNMSQTFTFSGNREDDFTKSLKACPFEGHFKYPGFQQSLTSSSLLSLQSTYTITGLLTSMLWEATSALLYMYTHPIFGGCQSTSHSTFSQHKSISTSTDRDRKKQWGRTEPIFKTMPFFSHPQVGRLSVVFFVNPHVVKEEQKPLHIPFWTH